MKRRGAEIAVRVIAIVYFITAALTILIGVGSFVGGTFLSLLRTQAQLGTLIDIIGSGMIIFVGILFLAIGIFEVLIGLGLLNYKEWARITVIVLSCLGIIAGLVTLPLGILKLIVNAAILYFTAFNKDVIRVFRRRSKKIK